MAKDKTIKKSKGIVYLIGAGPGDPGLLTLRGAELLREADAVVYDWLANSVLLDLAEKAEKIYVGKNTHAKNGKSKEYIKQQDTNQVLLKLARQGKKVVRLKGGDPFIFGRGGEEASFLRKHGIDCEVVPGVSAGYAAPAYAGIPVTDRRFASSVTFVTGHEDPTKKESSVNWKQLAKTGGTLVSFMGVKNLSVVTKELVSGGMNPKTRVSVIEWGTMPWQRVAEGTLKTIAEKVKKENIQSPAVTVIGEVNQLRKELAWLEKKPLFGKTVLVTRARAQASGLKKLLEEKGARVLEFPTIRILPPKTFAPLDQALKEIGKFQWIVFTSANGVDSVFKRLEAMGLDARIFHSVKIAVIGEATEAVLREKGLKADLLPDSFTSDALLEKLKKTVSIRGKHFLLPRTDIAPDLLRKGLEKLGAQVTEVVAYRTVPAAEEKKKLRDWISEDKINYVLFASSSTVKNFFEALPEKERKKARTRFVSIGPVTSATLRSYGHKPYREAREHTIPGLIEVLTKSEIRNSKHEKNSNGKS